LTASSIAISWSAETSRRTAPSACPRCQKALMRARAAVMSGMRRTCSDGSDSTAEPVRLINRKVRGEASMASSEARCCRCTSRQKSSTDCGVPTSMASMRGRYASSSTVPARSALSSK
jgi:hypothetical protein